MRRNILFRGKRLDNGKWVKGSLIMETATNEKSKDGFPVAFIVPNLPCAYENKDMWTARMYRVSPDTVGQFTGCLDKQGREVYEGNIVGAWSEGHYVPNGLIRFGCCGFFILASGDKGPIDVWQLAPRQGSLTPYKSAGVDEHLLVVGNIIDNPETVSGYLDWCKEQGKNWFD